MLLYSDQEYNWYSYQGCISWQKLPAGSASKWHKPWKAEVPKACCFYSSGACLDHCSLSDVQGCASWKQNVSSLGRTGFIYRRFCPREQLFRGTFWGQYVSTWISFPSSLNRIACIYSPKLFSGKLITDRKNEISTEIQGREWSKCV